MKKRAVISFNSPVILGMTFASLAALIIDWITFGALSQFLAVYYTAWSDPFMYPRLFTHVLAHADLAHYTGNFLLVLAVGPLVEEKYGSRRLMLMIVITALITGLINIVFFRNVMLLGASGIVFMLILLASFAGMREGGIPLTVLLVAVLYIGNEIFAGLFSSDNISHTSHIIGGLCGALFGFVHHGRRLRS